VRLEDNMMPVLTGLVFAVVLGTTVQNSEDLMTIFGADTNVQADDDVFFVRAGTESTLDVLANDAIHGAQIQIVERPSCGDVTPTSDGINYLNSSACEGPVSFTYCLGDGETCEAADVTMNVRPSPVAVADAYLPEKGDLVPLQLSEVSKSSVDVAPRPISEHATQLNAFVVTLAPQQAEATSSFGKVAKYMVNADVSDLNKMPSSDPYQYVSLHSVDVPLSALRTARFLTNYEAVETTVEGGTPLTTDDANLQIEEIEINKDAAQIDLKTVTALSNTQG